MLRIVFADGTSQEIVGSRVAEFRVNNVMRDGIDVFMDADDLNALAALNEDTGKTSHFVLQNVNIVDGKEEIVGEVEYNGYIKPMGVGKDVFQIHNQATGLLDEVYCAYFSLARQSTQEVQRPLIAKLLPLADDELAVECAALFEEWSGAGVQYAKGDRRTEHGTLYKCLKAHTSQPDWSPSQAASLWVNIADPSEEYPLIDNPIQSTNPWMKGQKGRTADGRKWVSQVDNNVWQPTDYPAGWQEVDE